jgi:membrane associated rhomboid family serine protease
LTARGPLAAAARLRGGNALEAVQQAYLNLPLGTRCWSSLIGTLAVLSQIGLLQPEQVAVDAHAIVKQLQIWRPVTAASFLGGLGPQLIQKLYYLISYGRQLEATLGLGEYLRVLASLAAALTFLFHVLGWQFTADGMIMGITVLCAQQMPDAQISLYGLNIPYAYLPFAQLVMSYVFQQQVPFTDIAGLLVGYAHYHFNDNLKPDSAMPAPPAKKGARAGGAAGGATKKKRRSKARMATIADLSDGNAQ